MEAARTNRHKSARDAVALVTPHRAFVIAAAAAAIGSGLMGGVFFAFSSFVMPAFGRLPPPQGIAAMQSVNVAVINPVFAVAIFGTTLLCFAMTIWSLIWRRRPGAGWVLAGCVFYLGVAMVVTFACNVPENDALAVVDPTSAAAARLWAALFIQWTAWNHVRTVGAVAAAVCFTGAVFQFGKGE